MNHFLVHDREFTLRSSWYDGDVLGTPPYAHLTTFDLMGTEVKNDTEPMVQISFSGFQCLSARQEHVEAFKGKVPDHRWAAIGFGVILMHRELINPLQDELSEKDRLWAVAFLAEVAMKVWDRKDPTVLIVINKLDSAGVVPFQIVKPIPQEVWHQMYAAKSLELTAAHEYFKSLGGQMAVEPAVPENLKHDRHLH